MGAFQRREAEKYGSIHQRLGQREKKVQERRGNESGGLGGCQGHLRELSGEADLWRTLLAKPISQHVSVCVSARERHKHSHSDTCSHTLTPWRLKHSGVVSVHRFKDQSGAHPHRKSNVFKCASWAWNETETKKTGAKQREKGLKCKKKEESIWWKVGVYFNVIVIIIVSCNSRGICRKQRSTFNVLQNIFSLPPLIARQRDTPS